MMIKTDWIMRQIESFALMLAKMFFNKETTDYVISTEDSQSDADLLYQQLIDMIDAGKINEAEDLLFEKIDLSNKNYLELAIAFYSKLNNLSDDFLKNSDFTREEIDEGLKNAAALYGIPFM